MSEFSGLRKHEKTQHALVGLGSTQVRRPKFPERYNKVYKIKNKIFKCKTQYALHQPFIGIDDDLPGLGVEDKERGSQPGARLLDPVLPLREPQTLKGHQRRRQAVVDAHDAAKIRQLRDGFVVAEDLHGVLDSLEELSRPVDGASDRRSVPDRLWAFLVKKKEKRGEDVIYLSIFLGFLNNVAAEVGFLYLQSSVSDHPAPHFKERPQSFTIFL